MTTLTERRYVSQYGEDTFGIIVHKAGVPADADLNTVTTTFRVEGGANVFTREAVRSAVGTYSVTLAAADTATPGNYEMVFDYTVDGVPDTYVLPVQVGPAAPAYDALPPEAKAVVEDVWIKFADLYDSPMGGPHLQVYLQTHFGRQRMAQLLTSAMGKLNTYAQPHMTYTVNGVGKPFPYASWGALLSQALYIEVIKHLIRSYTEQPEVTMGVSISRLDRRDYQMRWQTILNMEQDEYKETLSHFKMAHMGLGRVSVLVSGGAFGHFGPTVNAGGAGAALARGYYAVRRYN